METTLQETNGGAVKEAEIPMFITVKDGNGYEHKLANLDHPKWAPNSGIVQIEATKINGRNKGRRNTIIKNANDRETGAIFGINLGVDRVTKDILWERIVISEMEFFDLSKRKERHRFIVLSRHSTMEGSPNLYGKPDYRIINKEHKANNYLVERSERKRSMEIADNMTFEQMIELAPAFGITPEAHSQQMLTAEIFRIADNDHKKFLAIWDNPDRKGMTTFKRALKNGLITFDAVNGYTYHGHQLGLTEPVAYRSLTSNVQLLTTLDILCKEREKHSIYAVSPVMPEKEEPKSELEKALAAKDAEIEELRKLIATTPANPIAALKEEAKMLGIKQAHLMGEERLKEEIAKAKQ